MFLRLFIFLIFCFSIPLQACQIIYLNGTSSVGKTTIAKALQNAMDEPYMHIGIDQVIMMMPEKVNNWEGGSAELGFSWKTTFDDEGHPLQNLIMGPFALQMPNAFRQIALSLAQAGFNVIIDDVAFEEAAYATWKDTLKEYNVLWVGLTAPLEVIEKREKERGDRQLGQARAAVGVVHKDFKYDLFLDTDRLSTQEIVQQIKSACKAKLVVLDEKDNTLHSSLSRIYHRGTE